MRFSNSLIYIRVTYDGISALTKRLDGIERSLSVSLLQAKAAKQAETRANIQRKSRDALRAHITDIRDAGKAPEADEDVVLVKDRGTRMKTAMSYQPEDANSQASIDYTTSPDHEVSKTEGNGARSIHSSSPNFGSNMSATQRSDVFTGNYSGMDTAGLSRSTPGRLQSFSNIQEGSKVRVYYLDIPQNQSL